jgi:tRNA(Ile)-lysidine synthase
MNVLRGAGLEGLRGIAASRGAFVRPLTEVTRAQTEAYCRRQGIDFRCDVTNLDPSAHLRNRVRLELMPLLEREYNPATADALCRLARAAELELDWTAPAVAQGLAEATGGGAGGLSLPALQALPSGLRQRVLAAALAQAGGDLRALGQAHFDALERLAMRGCPGKTVQLPGGLIARRGYTEIAIGAATALDPTVSASFEYQLAVPGATVVRELGLMIEVEQAGEPPEQIAQADGLLAIVDAASARGPLIVRTWREGDRIRPLGMSGTKKLQDLFVDMKVPRDERREVALVVDERGEVLWVVGHTLSDLARVTATTGRVLVMRATRDRGGSPG